MPWYIKVHWLPRNGQRIRSTKCKLSFYSSYLAKFLIHFESFFSKFRSTLYVSNTKVVIILSWSFKHLEIMSNLKEKSLNLKDGDVFLCIIKVQCTWLSCYTHTGSGQGDQSGQSCHLPHSLVTDDGQVVNRSFDPGRIHDDPAHM